MPKYTKYIRHYKNKLVLQPMLGCFDNTLFKTPKIDCLAKMGTVLLKNYCQQAVCGSTRASVMTGLHPDFTRFWDLKTKMRDVNPDVVTLPQYLIWQGYTSSGINKIYHPSCVDKKSDEVFWSIPFLKPKATDYAKELGEPAFKHYQSVSMKIQANGDVSESKANKIKDDGENVNGKPGPATECSDLTDDAYEDGVSSKMAKHQIIELTKSGKPYFMADGFHKPHLSFVAPKKYWDMYKREDMPLAPFQEHAKNEVFIAYESSGELRNYSDMPEFTTFTKEELRAGLKPEKQKDLLHGYYASISYVDTQVGVLLNTLDSLGTLNNTIVVLWGDHGWHLGNHDLCGKNTNFEQASSSYCIISAPNLKSGKTSSLSEHVYIFLSICEFSGLKIPRVLQGKSSKPLMQNNTAKVISYAMSQYYYKLKSIEQKSLDYINDNLMGYSLSDKQYRLTL
jgi:arylsulfatase A-like enzyme